MQRRRWETGCAGATLLFPACIKPADRFMNMTKIIRFIRAVTLQRTAHRCSPMKHLVLKTSLPKTHQLHNRQILLTKPNIAPKLKDGMPALEEDFMRMLSLLLGSLAVKSEIWWLILLKNSTYDFLAVGDPSPKEGDAKPTAPTSTWACWLLGL